MNSTTISFSGCGVKVGDGHRGIRQKPSTAHPSGQTDVGGVKGRGRGSHLNLQHLQDQLDEVRRLSDASKGAANRLNLHRLVDKRLRSESEAVLLPVGVVVDLGAEDLLDQILWVRPVHRDRARVGH
eukprot:scaffold10667_cov31-Tisochrysis_lutea.AAC.3